MLLHRSFLRRSIFVPHSKADTLARRIALAIESVLAEAIIAAGGCVVAQALFDKFGFNRISHCYIALAVMGLLGFLFLIVDLRVLFRWTSRSLRRSIREDQTD